MEARVPARDIQPDNAETLPIEEVLVKGVLAETGSTYLFSGELSGSFEGECARCLDAVETPFLTEVYWNFREGAPRDLKEELEAEEGEDASDFLFQGHEIDLTPYLWEEVVLAAPTKYLCDEACAGLCPRCGINLNRDTCGCRVDDEETMENKGLAGLGKLFPGLRPNSTEE